MGLNLLMGFAGQICLAQGALFGVGAYATAITGYRLRHSSASQPADLGDRHCSGGVGDQAAALRLQGLQLAIVTFGITAAFHNSC